MLFLHLPLPKFWILISIKLYLSNFESAYFKVIWVSVGGKVIALVTQSSLTLCSPMNCSPLGSSVHRILQAIILEWIVIPFSRGSSQPRDQTQVSFIAGRFFTVWATMVGIYKLDLINMFLNSLLYISLLGKLQVFMKWSMTFLL